MTAEQEDALTHLDRAVLFLDLAIENAMPDKGDNFRRGEHFVYPLTEDQVDAIDHAKCAVFEAARKVGVVFFGFPTIGTRARAV